eukprot:scaffold188032_cov43-Tisochrysis_lutea.AAC.2
MSRMILDTAKTAAMKQRAANRVAQYAASPSLIAVTKDSHSRALRCDTLPLLSTRFRKSLTVSTASLGGSARKVHTRSVRGTRAEPTMPCGNCAAWASLLGWAWST